MPHRLQCLGMSGRAFGKWRQNAPIKHQQWAPCKPVVRTLTGVLDVSKNVFTVHGSTLTSVHKMYRNGVTYFLSLSLICFKILLIIMQIMLFHIFYKQKFKIRKSYWWFPLKEIYFPRIYHSPQFHYIEQWSISWHSRFSSTTLGSTSNFFGIAKILPFEKTLLHHFYFTFQDYSMQIIFPVERIDLHE